MKPQQSRQLLGVIIFFVAIFLLFTIFSWSRPVPVLTRSVVDPNLKLKEITYITATTEDEWLPVLRHGKIISFKNIDSEVVGLADKYKIIFESGHQAIAKLVEPFSYFDREWQTISFLDPRVDESISPKRAGRKLQGWSEVAAVIVSRIMFPHRKIPATMRKISSTELYSTWNSEEKGSFSLETYFKSLFAEHEVVVSVQAWIKRTVNTPPSVEYFKFLHAPVESGPPPVVRKKFAGEVSDLLVFDFLIDDHDRHKGHNWMSDDYGNLIFWDNGLAFNHGPVGKTSCTDLLCGPDTWREFGKKLYGEKEPCKKICKFREETVDTLRSFDSNSPSFYRKFSEIFEEELGKEEIGPFDFNTYYPYLNRYPKIQYLVSDFPAGMDQKISRFLNHVDSCISSYGSDFVLDPSLH